ncbi:hypothetical protein HZA86_04610 [Candidatus Uhrbacteria bacterium]|nr:hypothetical protein [Candidatus Uhrbacteria bacterium]
MKQQQIISFVAAVVLVAGGAFYGGLQYGRSQSTSSTGVGAGSRFAGRMMGQNGSGEFRMRGPGGSGNDEFVTGKIISTDATELRVELIGGGSRIVLIGSETTVTQSQTIKPSALKAGDSVVLNGTANQDGSLNARMIRVGDTTQLFNNRQMPPVPSQP